MAFDDSFQKESLRLYHILYFHQHLWCLLHLAPRNCLVVIRCVSFTRSLILPRCLRLVHAGPLVTGGLCLGQSL